LVTLYRKCSPISTLSTTNLWLTVWIVTAAAEISRVQHKIELDFGQLVEGASAYHRTGSEQNTLISQFRHMSCPIVIFMRMLPWSMH